MLERTGKGVRNLGGAPRIPCAGKDLFSSGMRHCLQFREFLGWGALGYIQAVFINSAFLTGPLL